MTVLLLIASGVLLTLIVPIFLAETREARGRLAGMFFGFYLLVLGLSGSVLVTYTSIVQGVITIGRRGRYADLAFADQPVLAVLVLLITLACTSCFAAFGWHIFKGARSGTLGP